MHKFKRNCIAQQRARIRQFYKRKNTMKKTQPNESKVTYEKA